MASPKPNALPMETLQILPEQAQTSIDVLAGFEHPLQQLESYVTEHPNPRLAQTFQQFKEALTGTDTLLKSIDRPQADLPAAATITPPPERSYMAMSSLFTINVKDY